MYVLHAFVCVCVIRQHNKCFTHAMAVHTPHTVWDNVYGFNMAPIKKLAMVEPLVDVVDSQTIVSGADKLVVRVCCEG